MLLLLGTRIITHSNKEYKGYRFTLQDTYISCFTTWHLKVQITFRGYIIPQSFQRRESGSIKLEIPKLLVAVLVVKTTVVLLLLLFLDQSTHHAFCFYWPDPASHLLLLVLLILLHLRVI